MRSTDRGLVLETRLDGKPADDSGAAGFALPRSPGEGAYPDLQVPRRIAALSLYRDLHGFYAAKDDLFPERTSGLIFFENMMGIFFSGLDLTEEVFAEMLPQVRVVVAEQEYDPDIGAPRTRLPAFALTVRMRSPEVFTETIEEAWQKALGLINFTRGQKALPGLIIDRPVHAGTKFTVAYFRPPRGEKGAPVDDRYNFRPAFARVGDQLILSSTEGLARDLIDAIGQESSGGAGTLRETHSLLQVDGGRLHSILLSNRENMVRQNMIEKGNSREESEVGIDLLLTILDCFRGADLRIGTRDGGTMARLDIQLELPTTDESGGDGGAVSRADGRAEP